MTPGNITVNEYEDVSLGAVVEGNPAPYVAWVSQKGSVLQNQTEQFNYTITNITRKDRGKYQCVATNPVDKDTKDFVINVKCKFATVHQSMQETLSPLLHSIRHILIHVYEGYMLRSYISSTFVCFIPTKIYTYGSVQCLAVAQCYYKLLLTYAHGPCLFPSFVVRQYYSCVNIS